MAAPCLLMLDEPSLGLVPIMLEAIVDALRRLNAGGLTILLVTQEISHALALTHRAYVLETGRVMRAGEAAGLRADETIRCAYLGL